MDFWRICAQANAATAFTGMGSAAHGGRWNKAGAPVVYCSENLSLAAWELLVHSGNSIPFLEFVSFRVETPPGFAVHTIQTETLPARWDENPSPPSLRQIGADWLAARETAVLRVPSAVTRGEYNFMLNPRHPDFGRLQIGAPQDFAFDARLLRRLHQP